MSSPFRAVAHPARRRMLDLLRRKPRTTGELAGKFAGKLSRFAVMQHLSVLVDAKLVLIRRSGRFRFNHLNPAPLQAMYDRWVHQYAKPLAAFATSLKAGVESSHLMESQDKKESHMSALRACSSLQTQIEVEIAAPADRVWKALVTDWSKWWRADFHTSSKTKRFVLEPQVGGRVYEDFGNGGGALWFNVTGFEPGVAIMLAGHMMPMPGFGGGPVTSLIRIAIEAKGEKSTLTLADHVFGLVDEKMRGSLTDGWNMLFADAFKTYAESHNS